MGTKSRVETQVRVTLDLAFTSGTSSDPSHYDRIGSWKWLKLPKGTATRKRSRKEGKIGTEPTRLIRLLHVLMLSADASPVDTLYLDAEVSCASNPTKQVTSCTTCQGREVSLFTSVPNLYLESPSGEESGKKDSSTCSANTFRFRVE